MGNTRTVYFGFVFVGLIGVVDPKVSKKKMSSDPEISQIYADSFWTGAQHRQHWLSANVCLLHQ
jgi:hypothetical protein